MSHICDDQCAHTYIICPDCKQGVRPSHHSKDECDETRFSLAIDRAEAEEEIRD